MPRDEKCSFIRPAMVALFALPLPWPRLAAAKNIFSFFE